MAASKCNTILFHVTAFGVKLRGTVQAMHFIKTTARSSFTQLKIIR